MKEEAIFHQVLEQAGDQREAFLNAACGGDLELRERVAVLLRAEANPGSFLQSPALSISATIDRPPSESPGTLIGRYKLLEQVGEGGMGVVYVAEQTEPVRRRVALKIIKPGMDTKQVIARFEAERQALAMMDHPNIARVFDAGTTEAGRPYFVMELVRGMPITDYCDKARLSPRQRLELFVAVCQAVQHAHQKGVIHRDLKPSNVMITLHDGTPVVKVIDFGVAKAVGQQLTERTVYTALTQLVGTPLYMSPEQAEMSGLDVDTRSDVYSLGVLLYELLTGQTPFDKETLAKAGLDEMRRIIREDEPLRPSRRFSTLGAAASSTVSQRRSLDERHLHRVLSGELDWIVMKALEKDRSRRYESASSLAADIQRYLSDEPVLACSPTTMYRFQKFARKHKPALATAAAIASCLLVGTTVSAWQAVRATSAEAQATANEARAQANAKQAAEKAQEATVQRDDAKRQRDEVKALNQKLEATQVELRRTLYAANINLAQHAWIANDAERLQELLEGQRPKPGDTDLRGFEWHYLYRLCHADLLTLKGHTAGVNCVAYSPDGRRLASAEWQDYEGACIKVWDAQTGKVQLSLKGGYQSVAFSPDGKRLAAAAASDWHAAKIWNAEDGQEISTLKLEGGSLAQVAYSPDGKWLAISQQAGRRRVDVPSGVTICDAKTGEPRRTIAGEADQEALRSKVRTGHQFSIAFSPDSKRLVTGESSSGREQAKLVKVWDVETGDEVLTTKGHPDSIRSVAFSSDGKHILSASSDKTLKLWDAQSGDERLTLTGHSDKVWSAAFSPDSKYVASASEDRSVRLWDAQTGQELATFKGHSDWIASVAFSPDGNHLASGSADKTLKLWDATASSKPSTLNGSVTSITSVAFSADGQRLVSVGLGRNGRGLGDGKVWEVKTGRELVTLKGLAGSVGHNSFNVSFNADGTRVAVGTSASIAGMPPFPEVKVFDARSGEEILSFKGHVTRLNWVNYSPDGKYLASASLGQNYSARWNRPDIDPVPAGGIGIWDAESGKLLRTLEGHTDGTACVAFSPNGTLLASGGADQTSNSGEMKIWNAQTGQQLFAFKHGSGSEGISALAFTPDGQRLASASNDDRTVRIWDARKGTEALVLKGHSATVSGLAYSLDGKRLATAGRDKSIKLWNAQTGEELLTLEGHGGWLNGIAFSPDGNLLACGGPDGTIKIYNATPLPEKP